MRLLSLCLLALSVTPLLPAQAHSDLDLQIRPEQIVSGMPQAFSFLLTNRSQHAVRVPTPTVQCIGNFTGSIRFELKFVPSTPGATEGFSHGCAADRLDWPPILQRAKEWQRLGPGESVQITKQADLFYKGQEAGSYEVWAEYTPPLITDADQRALRSAGIRFSSQKLTSRHVTFKKQAPQ